MAAVKMFADRKADKKFQDLYWRLDDDSKTKFGEMVRQKFDEKIVGDGEDGFYLTEKDIIECHQKLETN